MTELMTKMDEIVQGVDALRERQQAEIKSLGDQNEELKDRIEQIESMNDRPRKNTGAETEYKIFHGPHGPVYQLPSHVKMADVLPPEKKPEVALHRWLAAAILGDKCSDKAAVEYCRELKSMTTGTTGVLIPQQYISSWIDLLRAQSVLNRAGMQTVVMDAKVQTRAAVTADPSVSWHSEGGSISAANPTFESRTLTSQTLVARCQASVELMQDSPDFGMQLAQVITRAFAAELDRVGLVGTGSSEPKGIYHTSNIGTVTSVGQPTDYAEMLTAVQTLLEANVPLDIATLYAVMSPRTWADYEALVTGISSDKTQLPRPRALENTRFLVTSNVPNTIGEVSPASDSIVAMGDFRSLLMGVRSEASIEILKLDTYAGNLVFEIVGFLRGDFVVTRPSDFVVMSGITS